MARRSIATWVAAAALLASCAAASGDADVRVARRDQVELTPATRGAPVEPPAAGSSPGGPDPSSPGTDPAPPPVADPEPPRAPEPSSDVAADPDRDPRAVPEPGSAPDGPDAGAAGVGDPFYPSRGNGGYDVDAYLIDLDVSSDLERIEAVTTISARSTQRLTSFHLDLHGLEIARVSVDGAEAGVERAGDEVEVTPELAIEPDRDFEVVVDYSGRPEGIVDPAVPITSSGWNVREGVVYVASEPSGASSWFPGSDHPSDKATFEFVLTHDADLTAVANGVLVAVEPDGDRTTTTWVMDDPMATYLAAIYIGDFELRASTGSSGVRVRDYFPPERADELERAFAVTDDALVWLGEYLDAPYPFDEYGSVVVPFPLGYALENQTVSLHGLDTTSESIIVHEIAHQWIGDSVTVSDWQDIWLLEGSATYLSHLYLDDRGRPSPIDPATMYDALEAAPTTGPAEIERGEMFSTSVYFRGAMALHALRVEVGDDVLREVLATAYDRHAGSDMSTEAFLAVVDEVSGPEAVGVVEGWILGTALPPEP
ncbi:M1 family aminopeptidase [Ilumatobacter sp.]|uniref:M1 family metallopeptidase n=1 Tax=Ilumatobacter sp. TaxID=1967498 RepID=UPI003B5183F6